MMITPPVVVLDRRRERAERVAVEEVGRLVEDGHVRLHPHARGEDDLDLLAARERRDLRVGAELRLEAEAVEVLLDVELGELLRRDARRLEGDALVDLHHQLGERRAELVLGALLVGRVGPLHAGAQHSASFVIHEFSSIGFWQPTNCASYSLPFLPLRRETSFSIWPGFWPMSFSSSSVSSRKFFAWPSRSMPPEKRHSR